MLFSCSQQELAPPLQAISKLMKKEIDPLHACVLLRAVHGVGQGRLTVMGSRSFETAGLLYQLPATVFHEGEVLVRSEPCAQYVGTLPPGSLTVGIQPGEPPFGTSELPLGGEASLPQAEPLHISSRYQNPVGNVMTHEARLAAWAPQENYVPPFLHWQHQERRQEVRLSAALLRKAITACSPVANKRSPRKEQVPALYGVLLVIDGQHLTLSATTSTLLVSRTVPFASPGSLAASVLFDGKLLTWVKDTLPATGEIVLSLDEQCEQITLLLEQRTLTVYCRPLTLPIPAGWSSLLHLPHEVELRLNRRALREVIATLTSFADLDNQVLSLSTDGASLSLQLLVEGEATQEADPLPLVISAPPVHLLLNPQQLKSLVNASNGREISLQIGTTLQRSPNSEQPHTPVRFGFVRVPVVNGSGLMTTSRLEFPPASQPKPQPVAAVGTGR